MADLVPADVSTLIPGAPPPEQAYLDLARGWLAGELGVRGVTPSELTGDALLLARTAWAAKALAFKAAAGGVIVLERVASTGAARVIESVKIPDEIEVKFRAAASSDQSLALASGDWGKLADGFLALVFSLVGSRPQRRFFGASR